MRRTLAIALIPLLVAPVASAKPNRPRHGEPDAASLSARLDRLEKALAERPKDVGAYTLPREVSFCGETVDLSDPDIRERVEREFYLVLGDRAQVVLWTKRARSVFPVIEREAKELGVCADLKYVAVIESGLRSAVTSRAAAKGWWQFMAATGRQYGLDVTQSWDQRADLQEASRAGLTYLQTLHGQFGHWSLALAAYNTGPGRLKRAQETQGIDDFWQIDLYDEAERYFPRTVAIQAVLGDPGRYDFALTVEDGWAPRPVGHVKVRVPAGVEIQALAAARGAGIPIRTLRHHNPELGGDLLPTGDEVTIEVPQGKERALRDWVHAEIVRARAVAQSPRQPRQSAKRARKTSSKRAAAASAEDAPSPRVAGRSAKRAKKGSEERPAKRADRTQRPPSRKSTSRKSPSRTYTVRAGDSLWGIANGRGASVDDLRKWNKLGSRSVLKPGQTLVVRKAR